MVFDEPCFGAFAVFAHKLSHCELGRFGKEGESAAGRIENRHGMRGKAVLSAEGFLEDDVERADDVRNHRLGRIVNAATLTLLRVVFRKEGLVEVKDRIGSLSILEILVQNFPDIGDSENFGNVVDSHLHLFRRVKGNEVEDVTENANGLGDQVVSQFAIECSIRSGSGSKKTVGYGLRVQVSKLVRTEVGDEVFLECLVKSQDLPGA